MSGEAASRPDLRAKVAAACRVLALAGQEDLWLGHASAREPGADRFWMKRSGIGLGETTPSDVLLMDLEGRRLEGDGEVHLECPIHSEIYRSRSDVNAVVHTHSSHAAAFAAADAGFRMVSQDSVQLAGRIRQYDSPRLVATPALGTALAEALGTGRVVLLRNHGLVAADATVEGAVFLALAFERSLRLQAAAATFGPIHEIASDEVAAMQETFDALFARRARATFDFLLRQADGPGDAG